VYTFGKKSDADHLLASEKELETCGIESYSVDRGGDVTYHGPGQIVAYPIVDLNNYSKDIHRYLRNLEETIITALEKFGIKGGREDGFTGVWVGGEKIAAIGIKVSRWITMHGFALNVNTDLSKFRRIIPCGIFHKGVTSMQNVLQREMEMGLVRSFLTESFCGIFGCAATHISAKDLRINIR
jgi:lipoyl(octanoyl) transferase